MAGEVAKDALGRLCQPEARTEEDQDGSQKQRQEEPGLALEAGAELGVPDQGDGEEDEEGEVDCEGGGLEPKAAEQDVVCSRRVPAFRLRHADHCGAGNLQDRRNDVACDEDPEDQLRAHPAAFMRVGALAAGPVDEARETHVDGRGDEDGGGDDEEVLDDEVDDVVRVLLRREGAEGIADDFHQTCEGEG